MKTHEIAKNFAKLESHEKIIRNEWERSGLLTKIVDVIEEEEEDVDVFVDIGANTGVVTVLISEALEPSMIFAFEPLKENVIRLKQNVEKNNFKSELKIINKAVYYGKTETMAYSLGDGNTGGLFLEDVGREHAGRYKKSLSPDDIIFELTTLEAELGEVQVDLLKMDVEGSEWNIVENSKFLKKNVKFMVLEYHWKEEFDAIDFVSQHLPNFMLLDKVRTNLILKNMEK